MQENTNRNKKILVASLAGLLLLLGCFALRLIYPGKPNFNGKWKVRGNATEVHTYTMEGKNFRVIMYVNDFSGPRTMDVSAAIDGMEHPQTVFGFPATLLARWEGNKLFWELKRDTADDQRDTRRVMTMSPDGKTFTTERTYIRTLRTSVSPPPELTSTETWDRQ